MNRRPLAKWPRAPELEGKKGSHKGAYPVNVPWEFYLACWDGERLDTQLLMRFYRDLSLMDLYDILELREVAESWQHAYYLNNPVER